MKALNETDIKKAKLIPTVKELEYNLWMRNFTLGLFSVQSEVNEFAYGGVWKQQAGEITIWSYCKSRVLYLAVLVPAIEIKSSEWK